MRNGSTLLMVVTTNNITVTVASLKHTRGIFISPPCHVTCAVAEWTTVIRKPYTKHILPLQYQKSGVITVSHRKTSLLTQPRRIIYVSTTREYYLLIGWSFLGAIFIRFTASSKRFSFSRYLKCNRLRTEMWWQTNRSSGNVYVCTHLMSLNYHNYRCGVVWEYLWVLDVLPDITVNRNLSLEFSECACTVRLQICCSYSKCN